MKAIQIWSQQIENQSRQNQMVVVAEQSIFFYFSITFVTTE